MRRLRLWGSKLGEPCPVQCQCVQQPTPHRLVVQDRKALECPEFGQCRWPVGLCLLQECDSPSQPGPHGQTVCACSRRVCLCTSQGGMVVGSSLLSLVCCAYTGLPQKPAAAWFYSGAWALPSAGTRCWCPFGGGLCPLVFLSPRITLHPPHGTWQAAGAGPEPPVPRSDRGCLSPSRVPAGPSPHPLERAT